jgi:CRISPR-associated protein Csd1
MSILASLVRAYDRLPDAPPFGYSNEKIGFLISLNPDGSVACVIDLRQGEGKKKQPRQMLAPASFKRPGTKPRAFFLWDNSAYVLGVSGIEGKDAEARRQAFLEFHQEALADTEDAGLLALRRFLERWDPSHFLPPTWPEEIKDQNIVFAYEPERRERLLHEREAAKETWSRIGQSTEVASAVCVLTGKRAPFPLTHSAIRNIWGGQSSGGSIVSFNKDAFESYGHEQAENAPVSEAAAFAYTTALNRFLERGSGHRIQIGDASTVFWADSSDAEAASLAESAFGQFFDSAENTTDDDAAQSGRIAILLERIRKGEQIEKIDADLARGVRFHVLGLAPNAARISIRFYFADDFGVLARNYQRFVEDMRIEPAWRQPWPPLWRYLRETAVLGKSENVAPNLAGEWMRSILSGTDYPLTLLAAVLSRIRADGEVNALRAAMLRALLVRNFRMKPENGNRKREAPVALDAENRSKGYLLGRLFAVYEQAQTAALGRNVNATIKDKFYGSASATPGRVFSLLDRNSANHLSKVGKERPGQRVNLERTIGAIMDMMAPGEDPFPASLSAAEQALFGLGYYHQRGEFFRKRETTGTEEAAQ